MVRFALHRAGTQLNYVVIRHIAARAMSRAERRARPSSITSIVSIIGADCPRSADAKGPGSRHNSVTKGTIDTTIPPARATSRRLHFPQTSGYDPPRSIQGETEMSHFRGSAPYRIETKRATIRCWEPTDAQKLQAAISASVDSLLPWMPWAVGEPKDYQTKIPTLLHFRGNFDLGNDFVLGIFTKDEVEVIGGCGLHTRAGPYGFEIGYWINVRHQNKGYATEITRALIKTAFELSDKDHIQIRCDIRNKASMRVIQKTGFSVEGMLRHREKDANDQFQDHLAAILLREDYLSSGIRNEDVKAYDAIGQILLQS